MDPSLATVSLHPRSLFVGPEGLHCPPHPSTLSINFNESVPCVMITYSYISVGAHLPLPVLQPALTVVLLLPVLTPAVIVRDVEVTHER